MLRDKTQNINIKYRNSKKMAAAVMQSSEKKSQGWEWGNLVFLPGFTCAFFDSCFRTFSEMFSLKFIFRKTVCLITLVLNSS